MIAWLRGLIRPICPRCDGEGGGSSYWGDDWSGCSLCNPEETREEVVVRIWFWQVWQDRINNWRRDRWVDREVEKMRREGKL